MTSVQSRPSSPPHSTRRTGRGVAARLAATTSALAVVGVAVVVAPPFAAAAPTSGRLSVVAAEDAYTDSAYPNRTTGSSSKLVVSATRDGDKDTYLKFRVPDAPAGASLQSAQLRLDAYRALPAKLDVSVVSTSDWREGSVSHATSPAAGNVVATIRPATNSTSAVVELGSAVRPGSVVSLRLTTDAGVAALRSSESGSTGPRLALDFAGSGAAAPAPQPAPAPTLSTSPSTSPAPAAGSTTPVRATTVRIGMSAPAEEWDQRMREVGGADSRRLFSTLSSPGFALRTARSEVAAGRMPVLSFKVPRNDWTGVARGAYDSQLRSLTNQLDDIPGQVFVTLHHEPNGDGRPEDYAAMMRHALPILGAPANVDAGPIANGFWWSAQAAGLTDAEIARWLPADVLAVSEVVAADTYHGGTTAQPGEDAGVKIRRLSAWADRKGVRRLGIAEYNGLDARAVTAAGDAILADPRYSFATVFNSSRHNRPGVDWQLSGSRLSAFKDTLQRSREARTN